MTHCIFCDIVAGRLPAVTLYEDDKVMAFMDIFPLRRGHVLVIPRQHHRQLHELDSELRAHLLDTATRVTQAIYRSALAPLRCTTTSMMGRRRIKPCHTFTCISYPATAATPEVFCCDCCANRLIYCLVLQRRQRWKRMLRKFADNWPYWLN